jgi:hypothetical protein
MAQIEFDGDIAQSGAPHCERVTVLLDHAATQPRRQGFGGPPSAKTGKLDLDPDPARVALGCLSERGQFKSARMRTGRFGHGKLERPI